MSIEQMVQKIATVDPKRNNTISFVSMTKKVANKKSRIDKTPTPENLSEVTFIRFNSAIIGLNYEAAVNHLLDMEEKEQDFTAAKSYVIPASKNRLLYKHKDNLRFYLRVYFYGGTSIQFEEIILDKDNTIIPREEWKKIEQHYFPLKKPNENQGLDTPLQVCNYSIENILYFRHGLMSVDRQSSLFKKRLEILLKRKRRLEQPSR